MGIFAPGLGGCLVQECLGESVLEEVQQLAGPLEPDEGYSACQGPGG